MKKSKNSLFPAIGLCALLLALCSLPLFAVQTKRLPPSSSAPQVTPQVTDTPIARDAFTGPNGSALETHRLDTGQDWFRVSYAPKGTIFLQSGWAYHGSVPQRSLYYANALLSADCYVSLSITFRDQAVPMLVLRGDSQSENYIGGAYDVPHQQWFVFVNKGYNGPNPIVYSIGSWPETIPAGQRRDVRLQVIGDEVKFFVQGVERISGDTYELLTPGYPGISLMEASSSAGTFIDNFEAGNVSSATPTPSPSPSPSGSFILNCAVEAGKRVCREP